MLIYLMSNSMLIYLMSNSMLIYLMSNSMPIYLMSNSMPIYLMSNSMPINLMFMKMLLNSISIGLLINLMFISMQINILLISNLVNDRINLSTLKPYTRNQKCWICMNSYLKSLKVTLLRRLDHMRKHFPVRCRLRLLQCYYLLTFLCTYWTTHFFHVNHCRRNFWPVNH